MRKLSVRGWTGGFRKHAGLYHGRTTKLRVEDEPADDSLLGVAAIVRLLVRPCMQHTGCGAVP